MANVDGGRRQDRRGAHSYGARPRRRDRVQPRRSLIDGRASLGRPGDIGSNSASLRPLVQGSDVSVRRGALRSGYLARRKAALGIRERGEWRSIPAGLEPREAAVRRRQAGERVPLR